MTEPVEAVLFDLDGTLVEYERPGDELLALAFEAVGVEPFFRAEAYYDRYTDLLDDAADMADLRRRCFASLAAERGVDADVAHAVAAAYAAERDHSRVSALPGAVEVVEALAADHRLGLVTNGAPGTQRTKLAAAGLDSHFETAVFAGHDAPSKPDPAPFHLALDALDATPDRAVYVGNSLRADVAGARAAGCRAVWVPAEDGVVPEPEPDFSMASLSELLEPPWL